MKVGILTYHFGSNYGGLLQALALQNTVTIQGHDVKIINYRPSRRTSQKLWKGWGLPRIDPNRISKRYLQLRHGETLHELFEKFRCEHLNLTQPAYSVEEFSELAGEFDAIICGSDQIWNFRCSPAYFLDLDARFKGRKISYAACCTQREQPPERIQQVGNWIRDFDQISVRDAFSKEAIESASGRNATIVCDPTLLAPPSWPKSLPNNEQDEILIYRLGEEIPGGFQPLVSALRENLGAIPANAIVTATSNPVVSHGMDEINYHTSPFEWADRIRHSRFFITDSFHGVLFALKYQVPFLAYTANLERAPRMLDLADRFGIHDRIVSTSEEAINALPRTLAPPTTLETTNLKELVLTSHKFLQNALA